MGSSEECAVCPGHASPARTEPQVSPPNCAPAKRRQASAPAFSPLAHVANAGLFREEHACGFPKSTPVAFQRRLETLLTPHVDILARIAEDIPHKEGLISAANVLVEALEAIHARAGGLFHQRVLEQWNALTESLREIASEMGVSRGWNWCLVYLNNRELPPCNFWYVLRKVFMFLTFITPPHYSPTNPAGPPSSSHTR